MRIPPLTVVLALFAFTLARPASAGQQEDLNAFFNSGYSYCDASVLAAYWKVDITQAKARIGAAKSHGSPARLAKQLKAARKATKGGKRNACEFYDTDYSYEDAEALAELWGVDITQAKTRIARQTTLGHTTALDNKLKLLGHPRGGEGDEHDMSGETEALNAFWSSGLAYCDAELVGAIWGTDPFQVKISLGLKVLGGDTALLNDELARARAAASSEGRTCEFYNTPFSYDDAAALAALWSVDLSDAKARIAQKYTAGGRDVVDSQLKAARGR